MREFIEGWTRDLLKHPLADVARSGKLPATALATYLESLRLVFVNSERNMGLAIERSRQLGDPELVRYFERKTKEEHGHDSWAADDLQQLPAVARSNVDPAPSALRLIELQRSLIAEHPLYFVAYILWAEYFTVLVADPWLDALEGSGYVRPQLSALTKHVESDREHAAIATEQLDTLWHGEPPREDMLHAVRRASQLFEAFCAEIQGVAQRAA